MSSAQEATAPDKVHCPFKLATCSLKCKANDHGTCTILKNLEMMAFKVILG